MGQGRGWGATSGAREPEQTDGSTLFTKTIGSGITVTDANTLQLVILPTDTASLTGMPQWKLTLSLTITEADGRISKPWRGTVTVIKDLC